MPIFDFKCKNEKCGKFGKVKKDVIVKFDEIIDCEHCDEKMEKLVAVSGDMSLSWSAH